MKEEDIKEGEARITLAVNEDTETEVDTKEEETTSLKEEAIREEDTTSQKDSMIKQREGLRRSTSQRKQQRPRREWNQM